MKSDVVVMKDEIVVSHAFAWKSAPSATRPASPAPKQHQLGRSWDFVSVGRRVDLDGRVHGFRRAARRGFSF